MSKHLKTAIYHIKTNTNCPEKQQHAGDSDMQNLAAKLNKHILLRSETHLVSPMIHCGKRFASGKEGHHSPVSRSHMYMCVCSVLKPTSQLTEHSRLPPAFSHTTLPCNGCFASHSDPVDQQQVLWRSKQDCSKIKAENQSFFLCKSGVSVSVLQAQCACLVECFYGDTI